MFFYYYRLYITYLFFLNCYDIDSTFQMVSRDTALLNAYQSFLLAAMKVHAYVARLPMRLASPSLLLALIRSAAHVFRSIAVARLERARTAAAHHAAPLGLGGPLPPPALHLKLPALAFLAARAFRAVLGRKQAASPAYRQVLAGIDQDLSSARSKAMARHLRDITDPAWSEALFQCKF